MIKKSKITAAVMAAILAVTTIFSPVLAGEFSSPEEISEEFSENEKIVEYGTEAFSDAAQVQYDENEETFSTEEGEENNVIVIDNNEEFGTALSNPDINIIKIKNKITKKLDADLTTDKKIIVLKGGELQFDVSSNKLKTVNAYLEINAGATLNLNVLNFMSTIRLSGNLVNNGTVSRAGKGDAYIDYTENIQGESFEQFSKYYFDPKLKMYEEISAQKVCEIWKHTLDQLKTNGQIKLLEEK